MKEADVIAALSRIHGTRAYEADAEIVPFAGTRLLLSTDSFSEREDFLSNLEPEAMGRIMAYNAVSDILACGAKPEGLVQAWNLDAAHDKSFLSRVACGIQEVLDHYCAKVVGGDIGMAREWCWTATVFASCASPVRRVASRRIDFDLYASGPFGAANAAVFLGKPLPEPRFRPPVPGEALFATDSSGGLIDALENFRRVNPGMWLEVDAEAAVSPEVKRALPPGVEGGWSLVGGAGECELLFAVPSGMDVPCCLKIGHGGFASEGEFRLISRGRTGIVHEPPPDYRAIPPEDWLMATAGYWERMGL
ncbi:MAG: hypothetical protein K6F50_09650 [Kiritimatiellae bacterium]|nr:hypothetical protein [Kiritimatiellia bacterium]